MLKRDTPNSTYYLIETVAWGLKFGEGSNGSTVVLKEASVAMVIHRLYRSVDASRIYGDGGGSKVDLVAMG